MRFFFSIARFSKGHRRKQIFSMNAGEKSVLQYSWHKYWAWSQGLLTFTSNLFFPLSFMWFYGVLAFARWGPRSLSWWGAPDCKEGGRGFESRPNQHSGSSNNWERRCCLCCITSANGYILMWLGCHKEMAVPFLIWGRKGTTEDWRVLATYSACGRLDGISLKGF